MRIVGGSRRGMRLNSVPGTTTRPTGDMVKEALFNMLGDRMPDGTVLDLFAGSGALGIEALSRGAARAVFVEKDRRAAKVLRENVRRVGFESKSRIVIGDVFILLERSHRLGGPFDLIFADPPYRKQLATETVGAVGTAKLLAEGGLLIVEHDPQEELPSRGENIKQIRSRRYGNTTLTFYEGGC